MKKGKFFGGLLTGVTLAGGVAAIAKYGLGKKSTAEKGNGKTARLNSYYTVLSQWLINRNEEKDISAYLKKDNISSVAIYGMGTLGELLYQELKESEVKVSYFVDKKAKELCYGLDDLPIVGIDELSGCTDRVDVIIITPVFDYDAVAEGIEAAGVDIPLKSLEDIIFDM